MPHDLFPVRRTESGRRPRQKRAPARPQPPTDMLALFAERLSHHGDISKAASQLGRSASWGRQQFRLICKQLGEQAK